MHVARGHDEGGGVRRAQRTDDRKGRLLFLFPHRGQQHGTARMIRRQEGAQRLRRFHGLGGGGGAVELDVRGRFHPVLSEEPGEARGVGLRDGADPGGGHVFPDVRLHGVEAQVVAQALLGHAAVQHDDGDMPFFAGHEQARPQFRFQQPHHAGAGLIQRPAHDARRVQRKEGRAHGQPRMRLVYFDGHALQDFQPLPGPCGGQNAQGAGASLRLLARGKAFDDFPD